MLIKTLSLSDNKISTTGDTPIDENRFNNEAHDTEPSSGALHLHENHRIEGKHDSIEPNEELKARSDLQDESKESNLETDKVSICNKEAVTL